MRLRFLLVTLIAFAATVMASPAWPAEEQIVSSGQITFVSGGVGEDAVEHMRALSKDFNLKLIFAHKDGHYLADVAVTVGDARGAKVLEIVSAGPWFLGKLAPGKYQVTAIYEGVSFTRATTILDAGQRELIFRWDHAD